MCTAQLMAPDPIATVLATDSTVTARGTTSHETVHVFFKTVLDGEDEVPWAEVGDVMVAATVCSIADSSPWCPREAVDIDTTDATVVVYRHLIPFRLQVITGPVAEDAGVWEGSYLPNGTYKGYVPYRVWSD